MEKIRIISDSKPRVEFTEAGLIINHRLKDSEYISREKYL